MNGWIYHLNYLKTIIDAHSQKIHRNSYQELKHSYANIESVVEKLARILSRYAYSREKDARSFNSGEYDITHTIYATYCDKFITRDKRLYNKALAIYYYLGVPTTVMHWDEFYDGK